MPEYNNPAIARAAGNIAQLFAPPSASEMYAGQTMRLKAEEAARTAAALENIRRSNPGLADLYTVDPASAAKTDLYRRSLAPGATPESLDTSAYSVFGNYGNTAAGFKADQSRQERQNTADNQAKVAVEFAKPLGEGQFRNAPKSLTDHFQLPEMPAQYGSSKLSLGEVTQFPDGRTVVGPAKPLSLDEAKAQDYQRQDQRIRDAIVFGSTPIESVVGQDGRPENVYRNESVGRRPFTQSGEPKNYQVQLQDGRMTTVVSRDGITDIQGNPIQGRVTGVFGAQVQSPDANFTNSEQAKARQQLIAQKSATDNLVTSVQRIKTQLARPDAAQNMGLVGTFATLGNEIRSQAEALALFNSQTSGTNFVPAQQEIASVAQQLEADPAYRGLGNRLQSIATQSGVLKSAVTDLAYTIAKTRDPGGRFSVQDVESALEAIGARNGDPQVMSNIIDALSQRAVETYRINAQNIRSAYPDLNLPDTFYGGAAPETLAPAGQPAAPQPGGSVKYVIQNGKLVPVGQ